jgi:XTP/dITP diphosphohydrolase
MRVVLATGNEGKQRELAALLAPRGCELVLQSTLGIVGAEETGATFEANALLKARHAARLSGLPALADDSGLEVDALDGRPGVHSARYAGPHATDAENVSLLLAELAGVPEALRGARFRCVVVVVESADDPRPLIATGSWEGRIALLRGGSGGFGYDPVFIPEGSSATAAQLTAAEKNAVSHRAAALRALLERWPAS